MTVLGEKYNLARQRIEQDRVKIGELQTENKRLSDSLSRQCHMTSEAEEQLEKLKKAQAAWELEKKALIAEKNQLAAFASASTQEALRHREALEVVKADRDIKNAMISRLENEKARLLVENTQLGADLEEKQAVINTTSDSIDTLIYNTWKCRGLIFPQGPPQAVCFPRVSEPSHFQVGRSWHS